MVHQVPRTHAVHTAVVRFIEVGQSQAMAELVTEGAHTVNVGAGIVDTLQLVEHGKLVNGDTVHLERAANTVAPIIALLHIPLAGPHRLGHLIPCLRFTHTGVQHNHHIDIAITVIVINREVHIIGNALASLIDHRSQLGIIASDIGTIVGSVVGQVHWPQYIKHRGKLATGLVLEIMQAAVIHLIELVFKS